MEIIIDGFDFWNMTPQKYYAFTAAFKGDKKAKAKELGIDHYGECVVYTYDYLDSNMRFSTKEEK